MKQKIFKLLAAPALLVTAGLMLAGCTNNFDGTKANYEQKKQEITDNLGTLDVAWTGYVNCNTDNIGKAGKQSNIEIRIECRTKLDMSTVDSAITFYKLKNNTDNANYYPMHDGELTKVQVGVNVSESWNDYAKNRGNNERGVSTQIKYDVDTESVTTNKIAVIVDATKLKDVFGNFVLNLDKNYKAGQESDSWIKYIRVGEDKDGNPTTSLSGVNEGFRYPFIPIDPSSVNDSLDNATGKVTFTVDAEYVNEAGDAYDETLASTMKQAFVLRTKGLEEAAYKDVSLDWTYEAGQYKATSAALPYGTKYSLVQVMTSFESPAWITKVYGHPAFTDFFPVGAKEEILSGTSSVVTEQPDYIVDDPTDPADSGASWTAGAYDEAGIKTFQKSLLTVSRNNGSHYIASYYDEDGNYHSGYYVYDYRWTITPKSGVILDKYEDFIVVGDNYNKIETVISYVKNSDDTIRTIYIELKNPVKGFTPTLFVGSGTTLKENTAYPKQLKFGLPFKDPSKGEAAGYTQLY